VVDLRLVVGKFHPRHLRRIGPKSRRALGATVGDFAEVANQVKELLSRSKPVHQAGGHDRWPVVLPLLDVSLGDGDLFPVLRWVTEDNSVGSVFHQQADHALAVSDRDRDGLKALFDDLRRSQDRLDQVGVSRLLAKLGKVRAKRIASAVADGMTLRAAHERLVEDGRPARGIALLADVVGQRDWVFVEQ